MIESNATRPQQSVAAPEGAGPAPTILDGDVAVLDDEPAPLDLGDPPPPRGAIARAPLPPAPPLLPPAPARRPPPITVLQGSSARVRPELPVAARAGVIVTMLVFGAGVLAPAMLLAWAALALAAIGGAGVALLHTGGLEGDTFATSLTIGLAIAALLSIAIALLPRRERAGDALLPTGWAARHPRWARHPVLLTTFALLVIATLMALAASTGSPFFPYPEATIALVAAAAFVAVMSMALAVRLMRRLWRTIYRRACSGPYRAGFATAALLALGVAGGWATFAGWTARPARMLAAELQLDELAPPRDLVEAGLQALCVPAAAIDPVRARSAAAPACSFLPP